MATFVIDIQKHQERKDGTFPVSIRVTNNRKSAYIKTGIYVDRSQITKNYELKDTDVMVVLAKRITEYRKKILSIEQNADVHDIAKYLMAGNDIVDFFRYGYELAKTKGSGEGNYITALNSFSRFMGTDSLPFSMLREKNLIDYEKHLISSGLKRAPSLYLSSLKHVFEKAKKQYKGLITNDPFADYTLPEQNVAEKRALPIDLIRRIISYAPAGRSTEFRRDTFAKDVFLLSFYLIGMNSADLYHCPPAKDGRFTYNRQKTKDRRSDKAIMSVKIEPEAESLIEKYSDSDGKRAFCFYKMYSNAKNFNWTLNKGLKIIGKDKDVGIDDLEFYAARHSWANIATNRCKIPKSIVHEALNHIDDKMKITDLYIEREWWHIDDANRRVLDCLSWW